MTFPRPIMVIDTETTGLPHHAFARVIEIGAVVVNEQGAYQGWWQSLVRPDVLDDRANRALEINGISKRDLLVAPRLDDVRVDFLSWWQELGSPPATAYNVRFDKRFLERSEIQIPWVSCIMVTTRDHLRDRGHVGGRYPSLSGAIRELGAKRPLGKAHRALADAYAAAEVLKALDLAAPRG